MATPRRKLYEKARNIVRNNMQVVNGMKAHATAKNAHLIIMAYNRFQADRARSR